MAPTHPDPAPRPLWDALTGGRDFFDYADLDVIRRLGAVLWIAGIVILFGLFAFSSPARQGPAGLIVALVLIAVSVVVIVRLLWLSIHVSGLELLAGTYFAVLSIGLLDILIEERLYARLLLLPMLYVSATQPPRRSLVLYAVAIAVSAQPVIAGYPGARTADVVGDGLLWLVVSAVAMAWTISVHAQRRLAAHVNEQARHQARIDELTDLPNRRAFEEAMTREVSRAQRGGNPLALAVIDLDDFKSINDNHGHVAGDHVLRSVGAALAGNSRAQDQWFRWGGDEFAGVFVDTDLDQAGHVIRRLDAALSETCLRPDGPPVGLQVGLAQLEGAMTAGDLLEQADAAVLRAKVQQPA